jgi:hypothetical protein
LVLLAVTLASIVSARAVFWATAASMMASVSRPDTVPVT